jgi:dimethylargininase
MLTAITRAVSPAINRCELTFLARRPIDVARAQEQHGRYRSLLAELGVRVIALAGEPDLPDSSFVEDPVVVVDEIAVINRMGAESRRSEAESLARALAPFRRLYRMREPATLEGGDVLRMGRRVFAGRSPRTNDEGIAQLADALRPFGYSVEPVELRASMHLKSGCSALSDRAILANRAWIDASRFTGFEIVDAAPAEPGAANVLRIGQTVIMAECFPETRRIVEGLGYAVRTLDISELMKAESALTCSSVLFEALTAGQPAATELRAESWLNSPTGTRRLS